MTLQPLRVPVLLFTSLVLTVAARAAVTETFKQTYPLAANGTVHLDNVNGGIDIVAWDKAEVSLEAEKKGKTDADLAKVTLEIDSTPTKLTIKTRYAKTAWFGSINTSVRYKLMVPAGVNLEKIDSVNSAITVTGVQGSVNLETVNGRITATGLTANARLDSVNGSLSAEFASLEHVSDVNLDSITGSATVTLPPGASARVDADTINGRVSVDQPIKLGKVGRRSITGDIGQGGPDIKIETVNGSISIKEK
jgi:DUF4097 and DUF4098 domain-containing protein YvlB